MSSWECTTELAVKSNAEDFDHGDALLTTVEQAVEDVGAGFAGFGGSGWDGIEGEFAAGLQHIATVIGQQVTELSLRASALARYHVRAASVLGPLVTESVTLLAEAEAALVRYNVAKKAYSKLIKAVHYWQGQRDSYPYGSDEWNGAHASFSIVNRIASEQLAVVIATEEELDAHQVTFTTLRDDEKSAHQSFADEVNGVNLESTLVDVDVSGAAAVSTGMLLDLFDAAALRIVDGPKGTGAKSRLKLLESARYGLAGLTGLDLTARNARIADARLKREFDGLMPADVRAQIVEALRSGRSDETSRMARMLELGVFEMSDGERHDYLNEFVHDPMQVNGWLPLITLYAAAPDRAVPSWMHAHLFLNQGFYEWTDITDPQTREMLASIVGANPEDSALNAAVLASLFGRILETPAGQEMFDDPNSTFFRTHWAAPAVVQHLQANPHLIAGLALADSVEYIEELQRYLDMADRGTNDAEFDEFLSVVATSIADPTFVEADDDYAELGDGMTAIAWGVGRLLYEAGRVNESASFDPTAVIKVLAIAGTTTLGTSVGGQAVGKTATVALKSILAMWTGVEGSTRASDTEFEASRHEQQTIIAVSMIAAAGGPAAERLGELADEYPDPRAFLDNLEAARTSHEQRRVNGDAPHRDQEIAQYVNGFVNEINGRVDDLAGNDS